MVRATGAGCDERKGATVIHAAQIFDMALSATGREPRAGWDGQVESPADYCRHKTDRAQLERFTPSGHHHLSFSPAAQAIQLYSGVSGLVSRCGVRAKLGKLALRYFLGDISPLITAALTPSEPGLRH